VNSPEGPLYTKSNILFGYDKAKRSMLTRGRCILVEGQMDLLMAHQVGTTEAVALSGTALTAVQCNRMKRFTEVLILALDGDTAGIAAAERSVIIAYQEDMQVRVAIIPEGKDPADIIATDPQLWQDLIDHAKDYIEVRLDMIRSDMASASIHERYKALRDHVFPFINSVSNAILRDAYIQRIAGTLGVDATSVHQEYARWSLQHIQDGKIVSSNGGNISQQNTSKKIHHENMRLSSRDQVIALIEYMRTSHPENAETAEQHFSLLYQNPDAYILALASIQEKIDDMITMIGIQYDTGDTLALILEHALRVLELDLLQEQYYQTRAQLASQQGGEYEKTVRMLEQINKKIDELKKLL
jgi:DNA primase